MSETAIAQKLGGKKVLRREITSDLELAKAVSKGLPSGSLDYVLAEWAGLQATVYGVVGQVRTLQRKRAKSKRLSPAESDRLARLARILVRAEQALGDEEKAHRWLSKANRALGGQSPLTLLDSDAGALVVERVLGRIEHGVYS
jgi:putative toxin-antitoxin system antitoxin component (TIGR02293 family)